MLCPEVTNALHRSVFFSEHALPMRLHMLPRTRSIFVSFSAFHMSFSSLDVMWKAHRSSLLHSRSLVMPVLLHFILPHWYYQNDPIMLFGLRCNVPSTIHHKLIARKVHSGACFPRYSAYFRAVMQDYADAHTDLTRFVCILHAMRLQIVCVAKQMNHASIPRQFGTAVAKTCTFAQISACKSCRTEIML